MKHNKVGMAVRNVTKAKLGSLTFQVNPTTMTNTGGGEWTEIKSPGMAKPIQQYVGGKSNTITMDVYVNEWLLGMYKNAETFIRQIRVYRDSKVPAYFVRGSVATLVVVTDCSDVISSFNPDLSYREATISVTLTEFTR